MAGAGEREPQIFFVPQRMPLGEFVAHQDAGDWLYVPLNKDDVKKWRKGLTVQQMANFLFDHMSDAPKAEVEAASEALELMAAFPFQVELQLFEDEDGRHVVLLPGMSTGEEMTDLKFSDIEHQKDGRDG